MVITLALIAAAIAAAGGGAALARKKIMSTQSTPILSGSLLVTGEGEVIVDDTMPLSPELLRNPTKYVTVEFDPNEPAPPPCAGSGEPDELWWELIIVRHHHFGEELKLRIEWFVNSSRTIIWSVKKPKS